MAAFSTLALLGLGMAGGMAASKLTSKPAQPKDTGVLAPSQAQATPATVTNAPNTGREMSDAALQAQQAAVRQRRRAAVPGVASAKATPRRNPAARLQPLQLGAGILRG